MAKKKGKNAKGKAKAKGGSKSAPRHQQPRPARFNGAVQHTSDAVAPPRFTLRDEAQWVSRHRSSAFTSSKILRNMPIAFVSAGFLEGTLNDLQLPSSPSPPEDPSSSPLADNTHHMAKMSLHSPPPSSSVSSCSRASSEDVVVFQGRIQTQPAPSTEQAAPMESASSRAEASSAPPKGDLSLDTPANPPVMPSLAKAVSDKAKSEAESEAKSGVNDAPFEQRRGGRPLWDAKENAEWVSKSKPGIGWVPAKDRSEMGTFLYPALEHTNHMDDYAQNIRESGDVPAASTFANRPLGLDSGSSGEAEDDIDNSSDLEDSEGWNTDGIQDFDEMSTSTDMEDQVARIVHKRTRKTGLQYLVVYEGSTMDDARWLPATFLKTASEKALIRKFEAKLLARPRPLDSTSQEDSDFSNMDSDEDEEDEDEEDSEEEIDDETLARVLQKQEELGLGSNELLLHASDSYFKGNTGSSEDYIGFDRPNMKRKSKAKYGKRAEKTFPSASALADAVEADPYGGFDIMDTERPSLRPLKKGKRRRLPQGLEGSEFHDELQAQWDNDRAKKRLKKAEREELRKQGLLGRKGKGADLAVKYRDGAKFTDITDEIAVFMQTLAQQFSLPPMGKQQRAVVHEFVGRMGLNSKSRGSGANRFMVLSKTRRTVQFNQDKFDALVAKRKWDYDHADEPRGKGPTQKGRPATGYKDGDVVGGSAPEIGPENRGHALLSKMGWSKGMALGAGENKGPLEPIVHIYKTGKKGL